MKDITLLVLGNNQTGKTSLCKRFCFDSFSKSYDETLGDSYRSKMKVSTQNIQIEIVDSGIHQNFLTNKDSTINAAQGFLICYSIDDKQSFEALDSFRQHILDSKYLN